MIEVTIVEAQGRLPELLAAVEAGEVVTIRNANGPTFLVSLQPPAPLVSPNWPGYPQPGSAKGLIEVPDDFDEPLEELKEYWE
jgi:antitoxin (DNA-binding transcriptional repressor) of toxin-antitoxin stability system